MQWNKLVVSCMADNGAQTTMVDWDKMTHLFNECWSPADAANWMIDVAEQLETMEAWEAGFGQNSMDS
jgi:hypothetical protein